MRRTWIVLVVVSANLVLNADADSDTSYYDVLGVRRSASKQEIKQRYKQLAREYHPDKNQGDPQANDRFISINEAYEVLSDDDKRREYDTFGTVHARSGNEPGNAYGAQKFGFPFRFQGDSPFRFEFGGDFGDFFRGFPSSFGFGNDRREDVVRKYGVTYRTFQLDVIPQSYERPFLIYAYTTVCYACGRTDAVFEQALGELEQIGVGFGSLHVDADRSFAASLRVERAPSLFAVLNGRTYRLNRAGEPFSLAEVRSFVRSLFFESSLIVTLNDDRRISDYFTGAARENRVRAVLFKRSDVVPLRLLLVAYRFRNFTSIAFYPLSRCGPDAKSPINDACELARSSKVLMSEETLITYDDQGAQVGRANDANRIERSRIDELLNENRFLTLPRISSLFHFDAICRVEALAANREICVMLIADSTTSFNASSNNGLDELLNAYRSFSHSMKRTWTNVHFSYIFADKQVELVRTLAGSQHQNDVMAARNLRGRVAVIWRRAIDEFAFELSSFVYSSTEDNEAVRSFVEAIRVDPRRPRTVTLFETTKMTDEHALPLLVRISHRLYDYARRVYESVASVPIDTYVYYTSTVLFCVAVGYLMYFFNKMEEQQIFKEQRTSNGSGVNGDSKRHGGKDKDKEKEKLSDVEDEDGRNTAQQAKNRTGRSVPVERTAGLRPDGKPVLCELTSTNYRELILRSELGSLTIILLVDDASKNRLLEVYMKHVSALARIRSVRFTFADTAVCTNWYRTVLARAVGDPARVSRVQPANCVGTVLAVNGYRKWFTIYHVRHPASLRISKRLRAEVCGDSSASSSDLEDVNGDDGSMEDGESRKIDVAQFLANEEAQNERARLRNHRVRARAVRTRIGKLSEEEMLFGLDNWFDRLFEGSLERYRINQWPERFDIYGDSRDDDLFS